MRATCREALDLKMKRLGLFGTRFTARAGFYQEAFRAEGVALVTPDEDEQEYIHDKYMNELVKGTFLPSTRGRLLAIAGRMKRQEAIEGLIPGGTELPLILREEDAAGAGMPFLDTTRIHIRSIIARMFS